MINGLRRRNFRVKDLDVSGTITGVGLNGPGKTWYVDASKTSGISGNGTTWDEAVITIAEAITLASRLDTIYVAAKDITDYTGDPSSYEENLTIPATHDGLALIGVSRGRTQGGLPQLKDGATTTQHILRIRAPGCLIMNLGFNGAGNTGGGILLDDDYSTKSAFGTSIIGCHFKNCKGTTATNAATGGAINWPSAGNAWQVLISGCRFYKNVGDIVIPGTTNSVPQDVVIENCIFSGPAASVDCNIYISGSGVNGLSINNCQFQQLPAIGSGTNTRYLKLATGTVGMMTNCTFGCLTGTTGTTITFKASGTGGDYPVTFMAAGCYGTSGAASESAEISVA